MDYSSLASTPVAQIADKGRNVTFVYVTQGTYDGSTDSLTGDSTSNQTVKMLITQYHQKDIDGTLIKHGDRMGFLANDSLTRAPATNDGVTDGGVTYKVIDVEEIKPGDTVLLYRLQLRK